MQPAPYPTMYRFLLTLLTLLLGFKATMGQSLSYRLLSDSTITPTSGGVASGPAETLSGTFIWSQVIPGNIVGSDAFATTNLNFSSASYTITLATNPQPLSATAVAANGSTRLSVKVNYGQSDTNPWSIVPFDNGTFTGPADAPTRIIFSSEGFYSPGDFGYHANFYIDAILVSNSAETNQSTNVLTLAATMQLQGATNITATLTTVASPGKFSLTTKLLLMPGSPWMNTPPATSTPPMVFRQRADRHHRLQHQGARHQPHRARGCLRCFDCGRRHQQHFQRQSFHHQRRL